MSILDLCQYISEDTASTVQYSQGKHLLSSARDCSQCSIRMNLGRKTDISDGCIFCCPSCKTTKSLRVLQEQIDFAAVASLTLLVSPCAITIVYPVSYHVTTKHTVHIKNIEVHTCDTIPVHKGECRILGRQW